MFALLSPLRSRSTKFLATACLGLLMAPTAGFAQTSMPAAAASAPSPAAIQAYRDLDWTGPAGSPAIARKEAAAALAEGRRNCRSQSRGQELRDCLRLVDDDYRAMQARIQARQTRR